MNHPYSRGHLPEYVLRHMYGTAFFNIRKMLL